MDAKMFRLPTTPNFYPGGVPVDVRTIAAGQEAPAPDSRFPGWAAPMSDARLVTNYQPHCSANIPAGKQFPTKAFMQQRASEIIDYNRKVFAERMGADRPFDDSVEAPPALRSKCTKSGCTLEETGFSSGIGMERAGAACPELFGTFAPTAGSYRAAVSHTSLTMRQEGGRNSVRGVF